MTPGLDAVDAGFAKINRHCASVLYAVRCPLAVCSHSCFLLYALSIFNSLYDMRCVICVMAVRASSIQHVCWM